MPKTIESKNRRMNANQNNEVIRIPGEHDNKIWKDNREGNTLKLRTYKGREDEDDEPQTFTRRVTMSK